MIKINGQDLSLLGLVLTHMEVGEAVPKSNYVSIPYGNGSIDLTEALGPVTYEDRTIKATYVIRDYHSNQYSNLLNELHGLRAEISTTEGYHFNGRISLKQYDRRGTAGQFTLEAVCGPYMFKDELTTLELSVSGTQEVILTNDRMPTVPTIVTDANLQIVHGVNSYSINTGTHVLPIVLEKGETSLQLIGTANVSILYQEGML